MQSLVRRVVSSKRGMSAIATRIGTRNHEYTNSNTTFTMPAIAIGSAAAFMMMGSDRERFALAQNNFVPVATMNSIEEGQVYEYIVNDGADRVAVAYVNGKLYCVSGFCPHYSAQLAAGVVDQATIVCPWHGCRYCLKTGAVLEGPSMHNIKSFDVVADEKGTVFVNVPAGATKGKVTPPYVKGSINKDQTYVIVGGGPAALAAADALRENGFGGKLVMLSSDSLPPYDRTMLSKHLRANPQKLLLRPLEHYKQREIDLQLNATVVAVKENEREVQLADGQVIKFDKILMATGLVPRTDLQLVAPAKKGEALTPVEGAVIDTGKYSNVVTLHSAADLANIRDKLKEKYTKVTVIGDGPLAVEVSSALIRASAEVTLLVRGAGPLDRLGGERVQAGVREALAKQVTLSLARSTRGVRVASRIGVVGVETGIYPGLDDHLVRLLKLSNGKTLQTDLVVLALGANPEKNGPLEGVSGLKRTEEGRVVTDDRLAAALPSDAPLAGRLFIAGDLAAVPNDLMAAAHKEGVVTDGLLRLRQWGSAVDSGRAAALKMLGQETTRKVGALETQIHHAHDHAAGQCCPPPPTSFARHVPMHTVFAANQSWRFTGLDGKDLSLTPLVAGLNLKQHAEAKAAPVAVSFVEGDAVRKLKFTSWLVTPGQSGQILGACSAGVDPAAAGAREALARGLMPHASVLAFGAFNARSVLHDLRNRACKNGEVRDLQKVVPEGVADTETIVFQTNPTN